METSLTCETENRYPADTVNLPGAVFYHQVSNTQMYHYEGAPGDTRRLLNATDSGVIGFELAGEDIFVPGWCVGVNLINDKFTGNRK